MNNEAFILIGYIDDENEAVAIIFDTSNSLWANMGIIRF